MRKHDLHGVAGQAWRIRLDLANKAQSATLGAWLVNGDFHPAWHYWEVAVIHLRPIEGVPDASKQYSEAEHEFAIISLNPDFEPDPDDPETLHYLRPIDLVYQCHGLTDQQAIRILDDMMIGSILVGRLSPDSDYRSAWEEFLKRCVEQELFMAKLRGES